MSAGGIFKLIANEGRADHLITATSLLTKRIATIEKGIKDAQKLVAAQDAAGQVVDEGLRAKANSDVTLADVEKTHVLFLNAHFRPYAIIGYEYGRVQPQSGSALTIGSSSNSVTFSIPQNGDFFHDMVFHIRLGAVTTASRTALTAPAAAADSEDALDVHAANATIDGLIDGFDSSLDGAYTDLQRRSYTVTYVDAFGDAIANGADYYNLIRYCEFPANRLFRLVKFDVNGNPLDTYDDITSVMLEKFTIPPGKREGYNRLVGQEVPVEGFNGPVSGSLDTDPHSASVPDYFTSAHNALGTDIHRTSMCVYNGPQTPKVAQPALDLWKKLNFWFNDDVRLSIPSVAIPFGQRYITVDLAINTEMLYEFINCYKKTEVMIWPYLPVGSTDETGGLPGYHMIKYTPVEAYGTIPSITIEKLELYINNIFVSPDIHDIYIKRVAFSLIRVYCRQRQSVNQATSDEKLLSQLKWPIEYMFYGLRPSYNVSTSNHNAWRDWHRMNRVDDIEESATDISFSVPTPIMSYDTAGTANFTFDTTATV
jgi:hypothetical protein